MKRPPSNPARSRRVLVLVDESNVTSSAKGSNRKLDWLKLRDHLVNERELIEMVIYAGLPPAMAEWQAERDKKNKFLHWLRSNGFLVVTKDGSPGAESHYKANVDVLMAIDAVELSVEMKPDVVVLVTGDADFAHLAFAPRSRNVASFAGSAWLAMAWIATSSVGMTTTCFVATSAPTTTGTPDTSMSRPRMAESSTDFMGWSVFLAGHCDASLGLILLALRWHWACLRYLSTA